MRINFSFTLIINYKVLKPAKGSEENVKCFTLIINYKVLKPNSLINGATVGFTLIINYKVLKLSLNG